MKKHFFAVFGAGIFFLGTYNLSHATTLTFDAPPPTNRTWFFDRLIAPSSANQFDDYNDAQWDNTFGSSSGAGMTSYNTPNVSVLWPDLDKYYNYYGPNAGGTDHFLFITTFLEATTGLIGHRTTLGSAMIAGITIGGQNHSLFSSQPIMGMKFN